MREQEYPMTTDPHNCYKCRYLVCQQSGYKCRCYTRSALLELIEMAKAENLKSFAERLSDWVPEPCAH